MTVADLIRLREECRLTQTDMAHAMKLSMRAYQDIEQRGGTEDLSDRHEALAERASLTIAVKRSNPMLALPGIRREAMDLMEIFRGERAA